MVKVLVVAEGLCVGPAASPPLSPDVADIVGVCAFDNLDYRLFVQAVRSAFQRPQFTIDIKCNLMSLTVSVLPRNQLWQRGDVPAVEAISQPVARVAGARQPTH
ncbi:hypothetical protein [Bradyrhizobium guangdongense]|jgi:hypothetical protein|uniref:hypothetical protein n=1 Tax=Bradyrhizobium guangdongense TaxID=1325090 RepID=UPI0018F7D940|nr:hypothetical protein [Bradyrhizobium guangdongense]